MDKEKKRIMSFGGIRLNHEGVAWELMFFRR